IGSSKTAKATTNPTCILTNLNTKTRSSTLYANARSVLDSISLNFQRQPEATSNVKFQRSQESGARSQESGVRSQEPGVRSQESGVRSQESGVRSQEHRTGEARE